MNVLNYIGAPWEAGATGPNTFDCWGLVRHWYMTRLGIELPLFPLDPLDLLALTKRFKVEAQKASWVELQDVELNCIVVMGKNTSITHAGVYIGDNFVLHASRETGKCIVQSMSQIRRNWATTKYYKPNDPRCTV